MKTLDLPWQPPLFWSYLRVGRLLYFSMWLFVLESIFYWEMLVRSWERQQHWLIVAFWIWCFGFAFVHIFLVMADGWSRFQNYKRIKDQFYLYGFQTRIARRYMVSKCQRMAVETAAEELGMGEQVRDFYFQQGYRWYHFLPDFMVKDPLFFFKPFFWNRTFLEKHYTPRFDYRALQRAFAYDPGNRPNEELRPAPGARSA